MFFTRQCGFLCAFFLVTSMLPLVQLASPCYDCNDDDDRAGEANDHGLVAGDDHSDGDNAEGAGDDSDPIDCGP